MFSEIQTIPDAAAEIKGSPEFPEIRGMVYFFGVHNGTIVAADIRNLPDGNAFHGFHIHEGTCQGTKAEPFAQADGHYNPTNAMHPQHAGDMPSLLANDGNAFLIFYTEISAICLTEMHFMDFIFMREPVRGQKRNHLHRRTDTTIRQMPCTRSMQEICLHFWQMTEMHF